MMKYLLRLLLAFAAIITLTIIITWQYKAPVAPQSVVQISSELAVITPENASQLTLLGRNTLTGRVSFAEGSDYLLQPVYGVQGASARLYDVTDMQHATELTLPDFTGISLAADPYGRPLALIRKAGEASIFDIFRGESVFSIATPVSTDYISISADNQYLVTRNGLVTHSSIWNIVTGELFMRVPAWSVEFSADGETMAYESPEGGVAIAEVISGNIISVLQAGNQNVEDIVLNPENSTEVAAKYSCYEQDCMWEAQRDSISDCRYRCIRIWSILTSETLVLLNDMDWARDYMVQDLAYSPDGELLAITTDLSLVNNSLILFDTSSYKLLQITDLGPGLGFRIPGFNYDGTILLTSTSCGEQRTCIDFYGVPLSESFSGKS